MKSLFLPNGYKCDIEDSGVITIKHSGGYFKMTEFIHEFDKNIFEYGDSLGNKWDEEGNSLVPGRPNDIPQQIYFIVCKFPGVKEKVEIYNRIKVAINS